MMKKELEKDAVLCIYQVFKNTNMIKRILMALDIDQNFKAKKST